MAETKPKKKEKKDKKEKRSESDGVKKDKKEKKSKKDVTTALLSQLETDAPGSVAVDDDGDVIVADAPNGADEDTGEGAKRVRMVIPPGALVPFANPLADEKQTKKVLKGVKRAAKNKSLKRGVKEVVKSLRKSPDSGPASSTSSSIAVVIIAADISPMDVISHIPVLCEDHSIPYIYVASRAELGAAGNTKRPTSVVMVSKDRTGKKKEGEEEVEDWDEVFTDLVKVVQKAGKSVRI